MSGPSLSAVGVPPSASDPTTQLKLQLLDEQPSTPETAAAAEEMGGAAEQPGDDSEPGDEGQQTEFLFAHKFTHRFSRMQSEVPSRGSTPRLKTWKELQDEEPMGDPIGTDWPESPEVCSLCC